LRKRAEKFDWEIIPTVTSGIFVSSGKFLKITLIEIGDRIIKGEGFHLTTLMLNS
jgi:hypothetical protein